MVTGRPSMPYTPNVDAEINSLGDKDGVNDGLNLTSDGAPNTRSRTSAIPPQRSTPNG